MSFKCPFSCSICKRRHHALLHRDQEPSKPAPPAAMLGRQQAPTVLLGTALPSRWTVPVTDLSGQKVPDVQGIVQLTIQPRDKPTPAIKVKPWILSTITSDMPVQGTSQMQPFDIGRPKLR
ncbi:Integrase catalytic domain-containing protein [Aphis craccivora]|uniref:Integrase catalytic domain-containing protein n=1 Tax=Aphis craccivora TaxID=307492 RepID=A0A6G0XZP9_APHCR|nr:Integrase catalytic domain-containing protein [Aphis craccivora]